MIANCTHCNTKNDFDFKYSDIDYCRYCAATNHRPGFAPYKKIDSFKNQTDGIKQRLPQVRYTFRKKGNCSRCKRKNVLIYNTKKKLCQMCYRHDLEVRRSNGEVKQRLG